MTDQASPPDFRYDEIATGYARYWGAVIRPSAVAVLDLITPEPSARIIDIGTGTGSLGIAALERWPAIEVVGIDASRGMLEVADAEADRRLRGARRRRFSTTVAPADELPFEDGSFDIAISSFVLQLVPNRAAALREARRVVRPGGGIAWVSWLVGRDRYRGDEIADEVLDEFGFDPPEAEPRTDFASAAAAAAATRKAGFRRVSARSGMLEHPWSAEDYRAFLTEFDEQSLFADLEAGERERIEATLMDRLGRLTPDELTLRLPIVYVTGEA